MKKKKRERRKKVINKKAIRRKTKYADKSTADVLYKTEGAELWLYWFSSVQFSRYSC